jgi:hypothetical protein
MTITDKDKLASYLIMRAGLMQDFAIEAMDLKMFFKYHRIALYLIGRRINFTKTWTN